jgi:hypothetical protein
LVRTLLDTQVLSAGAHGVRVDGRGRGGEALASGVYFYRVETGGGVIIGRVAVVT